MESNFVTHLDIEYNEDILLMISDEVKYKPFTAKTRLTEEEMRDRFDKSDKKICLLYTSPSPRDRYISRMPSSA